MIGKFDLLGDPIPENHGGRGRPGHIATKENVSKVRDLLLSGVGLEFIAKQLGITVPTLRKQYFSNGRVKVKHARMMALAESKARTILQLRQAADSGNVSAMKEFRKIISEEERNLAEQDYLVESGRKHKAEPAPGKKVSTRQAAMDAEGELEDIFLGENGLPN